MKTKILLDTDIGSDIDDAVCLAYLLKQPLCELMGITTVTGEPEKRAMIASALCKFAKKDIPIYPGVSEPLIVKARQPVAPQATALAKWPHEKEFPKNQALRFLQETIRNNPGEITLLTIGPLTNIGLLFAMDREIPSLLKSIVMMCGVFTTQLPNSNLLEWNAMLDPHAAAIVYNSPVKIHRSIGLDVTRQVTMDKDEVHKRFSKDILRLVHDLAEVWFSSVGTMTFHDPLAGASIFNDSLCGYEKGNIIVEHSGGRFDGFTHFEKAGDGNKEVALTVNKDKFFEHYFSMFS